MLLLRCAPSKTRGLLGEQRTLSKIFAISPNQSPQNKTNIPLQFDEEALSAQRQALQHSESKCCSHARSVGHTQLGQQSRSSFGAFPHPTVANPPSLAFSLGSRSIIYLLKGQLKKHTGSNLCSNLLFIPRVTVCANQRHLRDAPDFPLTTLMEEIVVVVCSLFSLFFCSFLN